MSLHELADACKYSDVEQIQNLLDDREVKDHINDKIDGKTCLGIACNDASANTVKCLLIHGARQSLNDSGLGPIIDAMRSKTESYDKVRLLLRNDPDQANVPYGKVKLTPLHFCAMEGYLDIALLLLDYKSDINANDKTNETPLIKASEFGRADIVTEFLRKGADVTLADKTGDTALHRAAFSGHLHIVKILIKAHKCNPWVQNIYRETALEKANKQKKEDVVAYLRKLNREPTILVDTRDVKIEMKKLKSATLSKSDKAKIDKLERKMAVLEEKIEEQLKKTHDLDQARMAEINQLRNETEQLKSGTEEITAQFTNQPIVQMPDLPKAKANDLKQILQKHQKNLVRHLDAEDHVDYLLAAGALEYSAASGILSASGREQQTRKLLLTLHGSRDARWTLCLLHSMKEQENTPACSQLADTIQSEWEQSKNTSKTCLIL